ncbi:MAG: hypothetical protein HY303_04635 [Candidatus Wallbacteria bacterium]|nr:hypothetical protein [Candidatus Wallbacteria bacterium]
MAIRSHLRFTCALALLAGGAAGAEVLRVEELREIYGRRFCEVSWRTSLPCETRVAVSDSGDECVLRAAANGADREHRMLVPLISGRELSYSIVFPDGSRAEPRKLRAAAAGDTPLAVRRSVAADGTLELVASAGLEARWTLRVPGRGEIETPGGEVARAPTARFRIEGLDPEASIEGGVVRAWGIDSTLEAPAGPILGDRRLARQAVDALRQVDFQALLAVASDPKSTRARLAEAYREAARKTGLDRLLPEAAARAAGIAANDAVDAKLTIPLTYGLCRLGDVDWAARLRGWEPVTGVEEMASVIGRPSRETPPPANALTAFTQPYAHLAALGPYPMKLGGGLEACSFARLTNPERLKGLLEEAQDSLPSVATFVAVIMQIQLAMWSELEVPAELLGSPDGRVTFYIHGALPDPVWVIYLRLDDRVVIPLRVTPEDYRASVARQPRDVSAIDPKNLNYVWTCCSTSARFLHAGKNNWVLTVGATSSRPSSALIGVLREMRVARGTPAAAAK